MEEVTIDSIRVSLTNYQRVVILKLKSEDRYVPIWVGSNEADAIAIKLQKVSLPRPLTHDLIISLLDEVGVSIEYILIESLKEETFYAKIAIRKNNNIIFLDSRASDAIALSVRSQAPIFINEDVVEKASVTLDHEHEKALKKNENSDDISNFEKSEENKQRENLSDFVEFIDTLDLEGFGEN
ncbi:uncharacterized protein METZ01_LOCUS480830 [marine metagenome]|uniref:BFN domain-containing protein n=1 Tax=marine metagenome TaxID=408172 RepID=A0A383C6E5_9ZZZZ